MTRLEKELSSSVGYSEKGCNTGKRDARLFPFIHQLSE